MMIWLANRLERIERRHCDIHNFDNIGIPIHCMTAKGDEAYSHLAFLSSLTQLPFWFFSRTRLVALGSGVVFTLVCIFALYQFQTRAIVGGNGFWVFAGEMFLIGAAFVPFAAVIIAIMFVLTGLLLLVISAAAAAILASRVGFGQAAFLGIPCFKGYSLAVSYWISKTHLLRVRSC